MGLSYQRVRSCWRLGVSLSVISASSAPPRYLTKRLEQRLSSLLTTGRGYILAASVDTGSFWFNNAEVTDSCSSFGAGARAAAGAVPGFWGWSVASALCRVR